MADAEDSSNGLRPGAGIMSGVVRRAGEAMGSAEAVLRDVEDAQRERYRAEGIIAVGGMGAIEAVVDQPLGRRIARKNIHAVLEADATQVGMFVREARVTGQLQHPGIVSVHELGVDAQRRLYYTMERVEGRTLEAWIAALPDGPLDRVTLFDLLDVVVRVCDALAYAHRHGVLHCDVKPANVMVGEFGQVYLMDWGIACFLEEEARRTEKVGPRGTPTNMPPEQASGDPLDERADVFSVGALVYQILTRRPPFASVNIVQALIKAVFCEVPPLDSIPAAARTPPALARIVTKAMAPRREDRYESVSALKDALVRFMRGVDAFPRVTFLAGEDIVREGELGAEAYVIESGRCEVHKQVNGARISIRVMGPGEVFGEMAILSQGTRTASVTAIEPTTLLRITAETLGAEVDSMKPWMGALVRTLADRFRERESGR